MFLPGSSKHGEFRPLLDWLEQNKNVKMIYGGTKYKNEVSKLTKYLGILAEYRRKRKYVEIDSKLVDQKEKEIIKIEPDKKFNDQHIVALLSTSGCLVFASEDSSADNFVKANRFYEAGSSPSIYRYKRHQKTILIERNIVKLRNVIDK